MASAILTGKSIGSLTKRWRPELRSMVLSGQSQTNGMAMKRAVTGRKLPAMAFSVYWVIFPLLTPAAAGSRGILKQSGAGAAAAQPSAALFTQAMAFRLLG